MEIRQNSEILKPIISPDQIKNVTLSHFDFKRKQYELNSVSTFPNGQEVVKTRIDSVDCPLHITNTAYIQGEIVATMERRVDIQDDKNHLLSTSYSLRKQLSEDAYARLHLEDGDPTKQNYEGKIIADYKGRTNVSFSKLPENDQKELAKIFGIPH